MQRTPVSQVLVCQLPTPLITCCTAQGSVTVVVRVRVPGVAGQGVQVIVNVINGWVKTFVGVDAWAKSVKEINSLVKWADNRDYKITRVNVEGESPVAAR